MHAGRLLFGKACLIAIVVSVWDRRCVLKAPSMCVEVHVHISGASNVCGWAGAYFRRLQCVWEGRCIFQAP